MSGSPRPDSSSSTRTAKRLPSACCWTRASSMSVACPQGVSRFGCRACTCWCVLSVAGLVTFCCHIVNDSKRKCDVSATEPSQLPHDDTAVPARRTPSRSRASPGVRPLSACGRASPQRGRARRRSRGNDRGRSSPRGASACTRRARCPRASARPPTKYSGPPARCRSIASSARYPEAVRCSISSADSSARPENTSRNRTTAIDGSWSYCSKNIHCSTCARS